MIYPSAKVPETMRNKPGRENPGELHKGRGDV